MDALSDAFQVQNGLELLPDVHDLGGVVIDLQGGNYKISKPIRFPSGGGNIVVSTLLHMTRLISLQLFHRNNVFLRRKKDSLNLKREESGTELFNLEA